ncbi:MAG: hypothetical protein AAB738_03620 [Patescibacteria group bacterium]
MGEIPNKIQGRRFSRITLSGGFGGRAYRNDSSGNPNVFKLERNEGGLWLNDNWANPTNKWNPEYEFVFRKSFYFSRLFGWEFFVVVALWK